MQKTFQSHLAEAAAAPLNMPVFLEGYEQVLALVATAGTYHLHGLTIESPEGVYSPHETSSTRFFMDKFFALGLDKPGGRILEVGCGAGAIAIHAAKHGWDVSACDIDPAAVDATLRNAQTNGVHVDARQSDLFDAFGPDELFDCIAFNQPFFHLDREIDVSERTLSDFGGRLYERFKADARKHLKPGGYLVVAYSNCSNIEILNQPGWSLNLRAYDFDGGTNYIRALFVARPV